MSNYVRYRMDRERTILARKQIQLGLVSIVMLSAMILVLLFDIMFGI